MASLSSADKDVRKKSILKLYGPLIEGGKVSRRTYENLAKDRKSILEKLNLQEASNAYEAIMTFADELNFKKYQEDGGEEVSVEELVNKMNRIPRERQRVLADSIARPFFPSHIDLDCNGFISRDEWKNRRNFLEVCRTFESEEQARASFDSLDKNHNNKISLEEYLEAHRGFWGESNEAKDFYGTKNS